MNQEVSKCLKCGAELELGTFFLGKEPLPFGAYYCPNCHFIYISKIFVESLFKYFCEKGGKL